MPEPGRRKPSDEKKQAARRKRRTNADGTPRRCGGKNLYGEPCGAMPLRKGTLIEGDPASGDYCLRHDPSLPGDAWKRLFQEKGSQTAAARPRQPAPFDQMAQAVAEAPALLMRPYLDTLGLDWDSDTGELKPRIRKDGSEDPGARIVGFSREGVARISKHKNLDAHMRAAKELADRLYGKPRQSMELAGSTSGATVVHVPMDAERAGKVSRILVECGAVAEPESS